MGEIMKGVRMNIRAKSVCLVSLVVVFLSMSMFLSAGTLDGRRDRWKTGSSLPQKLTEHGLHRQGGSRRGMISGKYEAIRE
jgi:hypothetical protein